MPPLKAKDVELPALWVDCFGIFDAKQKEKKLTVVSVFDGRPRHGRISDSCEKEGLVAYSLDTKNCPKQDMSTDIGVQMFLDAMARCAKDSLLWLAPECGSWVWVCWSTSGRRVDRPDGVPSHMVVTANKLADFTARALLLATHLGQIGLKHVPNPARLFINFSQQPDVFFVNEVYFQFKPRKGIPLVLSWEI
jgi:hypothetical protein